VRVTESMMYNAANNSLSTTLTQLQRITEKVSSSKQLNRPSDNPTDVRTAVALHDTLAELDQYLRNIDSASSMTSAADTALGSASEVIQRASELAIQGANSTLGASDRAAIAAEVGQLIEAMAQHAGAKVGDQYIFSGFRTDRAPFQVTGSGTVGGYQGDGGAIVARIGSGSTVQVNIAGDTVFGSAFAALQQLKTDLDSGQQVSATTITQVQSALDDISSSRAQVGARANRLDDAKADQEALKTSNQALLSQLEDVDMPAAITELTRRQTTYQATLAVTAKVMQTSLIDYLR
jgi:flagellar hook-associated protein 3 FlgL